MKRKELFKQGFQGVFKFAFERSDELVEGVSRIWKQEAPNSAVDEENQIKKTTPVEKKEKKKNFQPKLAKPPGAHSDYLSLCTGCKECVFACPYSVLFTVEKPESGKSYAFFDPNERACHLCQDFPCINACPTGALQPLTGSELPKWGKAKGIFDLCINSKTMEKTCTACQTVCPVPETVKFQGIQPKFSPKSCTGCGLCTEVCPTFPKAIQVTGLRSA